MRIFVPILVGLVAVSMNAHSGGISYETSIAFDDGLTDQLDRLNIGTVYERLSKPEDPGSESFWSGCDAASIFGTGALCQLNASSYSAETGLGSLGGWHLLGQNLTANIGELAGEKFYSQTESSGRGSDSSSLSGSFQIGFSDDVVNEIMVGNDQGIRLGYGLSWIGFGIFDDFNGVMGQWASLPVEGADQLSKDLSIRSSFRVRITAGSTDYSLQLAEEPRVILDETLTGDSEIGMIFPPDPASYGFTKGDIVSFRLDVEQRLWTERNVVKVLEPNSIGLLLASLVGLGVVRVFSKKTKEY